MNSNVRFVFAYMYVMVACLPAIKSCRNHFFSICFEIKDLTCNFCWILMGTKSWLLKYYFKTLFLTQMVFENEKSHQVFSFSTSFGLRISKTFLLFWSFAKKNKPSEAQTTTRFSTSRGKEESPRICIIESKESLDKKWSRVLWQLPDLFLYIQLGN